MKAVDLINKLEEQLPGVLIEKISDVQKVWRSKDSIGFDSLTPGTEGLYFQVKLTLAIPDDWDEQG